MTHLRWRIAALLFWATVLGYIDRGLIGFLKSDLQQSLHWSEIDYGNVVAVFSLAYAFGQLFAGRMMDLIGIRLGFMLAVLLWSVAAMGHAVASTLAAFFAVRALLGLAEGGNFPGAAKAVSEWYPKKERALATGIFNAGCTVGSILTPVVVNLITLYLKLNWRYSFIATGLAGLIWVPVWLWLYHSPEHHPRLSPRELSHINSDPADPAGDPPSWLSLLARRPTWAIVIGLSLTSPVWWFYLYWFPDFLGKAFHLDKHQQQGPVMFVYAVAGVGSVAGGYLSSALIRRGRTVNFGRKAAMLVCVLAVLPVFFASRAGGVWSATMLVALAAGAHQGWAANLYTLASDTQPRRTVSSIIGIGGMSAGLVAMVFQHFCGEVLQSRGAAAYPLLFGICAAAYPVALLCIDALLPGDRPSFGLHG